jgi:hypothetical protein
MFAGEKNYVRLIPPRRALQFPATGYGSTSIYATVTLYYHVTVTLRAYGQKKGAPITGAPGSKLRSLLH